MRYLLDTHALLWFFEDSPRLPDYIATVIEDAEAQKFICAVSLWEFTIKHSLGKLDFDGGVAAFWNMALCNGVTILPIVRPYLDALELLPFLHRDPFDRLIIATAITENMTILTADDDIQQYNVVWYW